MTTLELEITAETSYVAYEKKAVNGGAAISSPGSDSSSSSYYSSSSDDEADVQPSKQSARTGAAVGKRSKRPNPKLVKVIEGVSLALAVAVVLSLFSLPIYFYKTESAKNQTGWNFTEPTSSPDDIEPALINLTGICSELSWGDSSSRRCSGTLYLDDGVCRDYLLTWHQCIMEESFNGPLRVAVSTSELETLERNAMGFLQALDTFQQFSTAECNAVAVPFVCLYLFPLCGNGGQVYLPSQELCTTTSTVTCQRLWTLAESFGYGDQLPVCANLPAASVAKNTTATPVSSINISCSFGFYKHDGICSPDCYTYIGSPSSIARTNQIIVEVAFIFGLIVSIMVFILSFIRRKVLWKFPHVFLIYVTIDYDILGIFVLISIGDRDLYCSSRSVIQTLINPTTFCTTAGVVNHYFVINMLYFWFFHVCSTFYKLMFPHLAKRTETKQVFIHVSLVLLALILPLPPVIAVLTIPDYEYTVADFPPYFCLSKSLNVVVFYSTVVVLNVLLAVGVCLFIPIFYIIHKHRLAIGMKKPKWRISTIGRKILITLCYFMAFGVVSLVYFAVILAEQEKILQSQENYFLCEVGGENSQNLGANCSDFLSEVTNYSALGTTTFTLLGILPLVIFTFLVDWKRFLKKLNGYRIRCYHHCVPHDKEQVEFSTYTPVSATLLN